MAEGRRQKRSVEQPLAGFAGDAEPGPHVGPQASGGWGASAADRSGAPAAEDRRGVAQRQALRSQIVDGTTTEDRGRRTGFTLMEVLVATIILGVLAMLALPSFERLRERSYHRHAMDVLLTIYTAERGYLADHGEYLGPLDPGDNWRPLGMDDPNDARFSPVRFTVVATPPPLPTFRATATREAITKWITIDDARQIVDNWNP